MAKTQAAALDECRHPHAIALPDGSEIVVPFGMRLRADHPAVTQNPGFFCAADLPDDEKPHWRDAIGPGTTTTHRPVPSGFRRDWHGGGA
jgi:hypothetical protein